MKKILILSFFILFCLTANAQPFAPVGAVWYYQSGGFSSATYYPVRIESVKDTIVQGISCRQLNFPSNPGNIIYSDTDKVYLFDSYQQLFVKIYDFSLHPGDTLTYHFNFYGSYIDTSSYIIDSTAFISINGKIKKLQFTHFLNTFKAHHSSFFMGGNIIEGIGSKAFLLPQYSQADPLILNLRCFTDTNFGYYNTGIVAKCDSVITNVSEESKHQLDIAVFPNPATNELFINTDCFRNYRLIIYNSIGQLILQKDCTSALTKINLESFKKAMYYFTLTDITGIFYSGKIIKE